MVKLKQKKQFERQFKKIVGDTFEYGHTYGFNNKNRDQLRSLINIMKGPIVSFAQSAVLLGELEIMVTPYQDAIDVRVIDKVDNGNTLSDVRLCEHSGW